MPIDIKIPEVGESITEVQISEWLKSEGDPVTADETVAVIDSEKTTFDLPAPKAGQLVKILHRAGDTVKVGEVVAQIETNGAAPKEKPADKKESAKAKPEPRSESKPDANQAEKSSGEKKSGATADAKSAGAVPASKKEKTATARSETPEMPESAPEPEEPRRAPRRTSPDTEMQATSPAGHPGGEEEFVPMTMLRRTVARRLVEAQQAMAMLTTFNEVDMSAVLALRKEHGEAFEKRYHVRLGFMSFFVKAAIDALKQFPKLNAEIRHNDIVYRNYFDIGVAIASDRGLVVPVLRRAERSSIAELETMIGNFAQSARAGKLKPTDLEGGTFTITNGGVFGSLLSTPIINPPQTGILGMHTIQERPVALNGQVVIRPMMYLALTYDHRLVDGR
ncbi:MAG TPA: 2-oxoglutarate dehydrogenase complex dihydrolipoyllysine-residue succinyltransferase, partial [Candidatus Binatia bacterium]|nr:2-oxoglutarate dehydrogenase complex dihydrolipoyllysine-residue succinyltransferase [Candidatus Binatia bacterium]